ncbi:serine protease [Providencia rettgeri]|uniref:trypsin-like serine peptidase n=1 Tax=Providencia rettgeri TaxID=587 RepID=UPI0034E0ABEF
METYQISSFSEEINIDLLKDSPQQRIHALLVKRENASFLKLYFENIKLPQYSYVEFEYGEGYIQRESFDHDGNNSVIIIPNQWVNIRVILPKKYSSDDNFSFLLSKVKYDRSYSRVIIGEDERKPYMCYERSPIAEYALSSAAARIGKWGSCSLIGSENHVLTNHHVVASDPKLVKGEIWFNWFNGSCCSTSTVSEPVRLRPGKILKMGASESDNDYALLTLDEFDYLNSNVKALFGGLKLSQTNPTKGENIYIPQYGNGGLRPMYISDIKNGKFTEILNIENKGNKITYNADTQGGSSGSPVISRTRNQLIGLHWGGGNVNVGVSAQKLNVELGYFIEKSNIPVIGLGKVISTNFELTPMSSPEQCIPIFLSEGSRIEPFDTVKIEHYSHYSILYVKALDLATNDRSLLTLKAGLVKNGCQTHLHGNVTGDVFFKLYDFDFEKNGLFKFWVTFKIVDDTQNIKNHVIRLVFDNYDPYDVPFDIESAEILDLNLRKDKKNATGYMLNGSDYYGFVALYRDQGPLSLVWSDKKHSQVKGILKASSGDEVFVNFRGFRKTDCSASSMNSAASCSSSNKYSRLALEYFPEDNTHLILGQGVYEGIIPLQAKSWEGAASQNILVKVSLWSE